MELRRTRRPKPETEPPETDEPAGVPRSPQPPQAPGEEAEVEEEE